GRVELLLVVERPRAGADAEAAVALDDLADLLALLGDMTLAALVAEEGEGHLVEVEAEAPREERGQGLRLRFVDQRRLLARGEGELRLRRVGDPADRDRALRRGDVAHRGEAVEEGREQVAEDLPRVGQAADLDRLLGDDAEPPLAAEDHLAHARPGRGGRDRLRPEVTRRGDDGRAPGGEGGGAGGG